MDKTYNGFVFGKFSNFRITGAAKGIKLIEPYLQDFGINIEIFSINSLKTLIISFLKYIKHQHFRRIDFVMINALGSFYFYPFTYWIIKVFLGLRVPVFIYWRELKMAFDDLEKKKPHSAILMNKVVLDRRIIHLANSRATQKYIQTRYPTVQSLTDLQLCRSSI